jgi:hypothetical protein
MSHSGARGSPAQMKQLGLHDERKHARTAPRISASKINFPNGDVRSYRGIDVSLSGASR